MANLQMPSSLQHKFVLLEQLRQQTAQQKEEKQPKAESFWKSTGQSIARSFLATGSQIYKTLFVPKEERKPFGEASYTPVEDWEKKIFGTDKPVSFKSIGEEMLLVGGDDFKKKWGSYSIPLGMVIAGLDITPIGGGGKSSVVKQGVKKIAKTKSIPTILKTLKTIVKGSDDELKFLAKSLKNITNEKDVVKLITSTGKKLKAIKPAVKVATKLKTPTTKVVTPITKKAVRQIPAATDTTVAGFKGTVAKVNEMLKTAKVDLKKVKALQRTERAKRFAKVENFITKQIDNVGGEEGYRKVLSMLKGELIPSEERALLAPLKNRLNATEMKTLFQGVWKHPYLTTGEKTSTAKGLMQLLTGELPQPHQLTLMEEVFGTDFIKTILSKRIWGAKAMDVFIETMNVPRVALATADMSAFLRQGIIELIAHPVIGTKAIARTFRFAVSPDDFVRYFDDLVKDPLFKLMRKSGVAITNPSKVAGGLGAREEAFISRFLQKIPIVNIPTTFAERSYTGFLTKMRVDIFKCWADELLTKGYSPVKDADLFKAAAEVVNTFTGRGSLGALNKIAPEMSIAFFSPRLIAARFNAMNPIWYARLPAPIRQKAIMDFAKFVGVGITTLGMIKMYKEANNIPDRELSLETNPISADFGKIKIGNTRFDIWGGFQQWVRVIAQIATGERKNTTTGEIVSLTKDEYPFTTRKEVLLRFIEGKMAPVPALVNELMAGGKTFTGEDMTLASVLREKFIPMYIQDIMEAYADGGMGKAVGAGGAAFFGIGVQTYPIKKGRTSTRGGSLKMPSKR